MKNKLTKIKQNDRTIIHNGKEKGIKDWDVSLVLHNTGVLEIKQVGLGDNHYIYTKVDELKEMLDLLTK